MVVVDTGKHLLSPIILRELNDNQIPVIAEV